MPGSDERLYPRPGSKRGDTDGMTHAEPTPRLTPETWACVRADFLSGVSAPVLAERYGASVRNIRRRAAIEGWRRADFTPGRLAPPPPWMAGRPTKDEEMDLDPALEEIDEAESVSRFGLLFNPDGRSLHRFAFRQASENAAIDQPQQALAWMRLAQMVERSTTRLDSDSLAFRQIDYIRAAYLRRLKEAVDAHEEPEDEEDAEEPDADLDACHLLSPENAAR